MKTCPKCGVEYPDATTLCPADGVALEKTDDALLGQTLAGKYRIEEKLSAGGMGTVYRGTHVLMDKTVAVKVLRSSLAADEKIVARFSREARAASRISHPHALSVTDFGEAEGGVVFLVMEYLSGQTLKQIIREEGPMALPRAVEILRQVGGALDAAHAEGVVHRDLKSDNIMLLSSSGADYAKVLDFGIAKIKEPEGTYDPGLTAPDLVIGTPQYMSPEQCSQSPDIDARSDIYSLGVILYEMLVGHVPFTGGSPTAIMLKHLQHPAPSVLDERGDVPEAIGGVVARAMEKRPEDRYETVAELVEDFTIAAGMELAGVSTPAEQKRVEQQPPQQLADDADEETLVRRRVTRAMAPPLPPPQASAAPPSMVVPLPDQAPAPHSSFNPWKILIPSLVGLLILFGLIYAFTRNTLPTEANTGSQPLAADPNSSPVEPAKPPTGAAEAGIPSGGNTNQNANVNANVSASPSPGETPINGDANINANDNTNQNSNSAKPSPTKTVEVEPPPPFPTATNPPLPKPSVAPTTASTPNLQ
ncbi:MAG TPA: serine/threonine-protein kinase [Pyrinomonadaceae bacterium]|jgi:serine/threonine-protein kinase|nr:serine/threonine-protein kinase [Pyrinomonadaceae bacterium]